jgi:hypothetical protein
VTPRCAKCAKRRGVSRRNGLCSMCEFECFDWHPATGFRLSLLPNRGRDAGDLTPVGP